MFARAFGTAIRPITLGRGLLGLIDSLDSQEPMNPHFTINLSAKDHAAFADIEKYLSRELAEAATQYAEQNGFEHDLPISVVLTINDSMKIGKFEITSSTTTSQQPITEASKPVLPIEIGKATTANTLVNATLVLKTGDRILLEGETLKIGRQASCRVVYNDSNVSREHAQMRRTADGWKILDLGSTNGTKINGVVISEEQLLVNGDELSFGTSSATFEIS